MHFTYLSCGYPGYPAACLTGPSTVRHAPGRLGVNGGQPWPGLELQHGGMP